MPGAPDQPYRQFVASLWVLVRTAGTRSAAAQLTAAADDCWRCLQTLLADAGHLVLQEHGGALFANGRRIRPDVATFAATAGITVLLQDNGITELLLQSDAGVHDLELLGACWHDSAARTGFDDLLRQRGCIGLHVAQGRDGAPPVEASAAPPPLVAPSQLGAVFTMQRFAAALGAAGPLAGSRARAILQAVLHRLLRAPGGLDPLARMQRDPVAHAEAVRACVLAVRTAEELGWDDERSLGAGLAALLGAAAGGGDGETGELARAAQAVAALIGGGDSAGTVLQHLQMQGQLPAFVGNAMEVALGRA